jgi:Cupin-like domain
MRMAKHADEIKLQNDTVHYYFMANAQPGDQRRSFIGRDLPLFSTHQENFFITDVKANRGIQCRFSMRGIISESHYDTGKNFIAMIRGAKRYILNPPYTCKQLGIIKDNKHPSYRHSAIDWSNVEEAEKSGFGNVDAIDTIVRKNELLYVPSFWFHYIVSLQYSGQCNSRSGVPPNHEGLAEVEECLDMVFNVDQ